MPSQIVTDRFFKFLRSIFVFAICLAFCCSCASVYVSSVRHTPLHSKRGELQGSVSFGNGANANAAFAITDHVGIMAGGLYANNRAQNFNNTYRRHHSAEVAMGYFGNNKRISYETYVGYGTGKGYAQDSVFGFFFFANIQRTTEGQYNRFFVQPTFAFRPKRFYLAVTLRVSYIEFRNALTMVDNANPQRQNLYTYVFEPSFTSKYFISNKPKSMFVFAQVGFNLADQTNDIEYNMPFFMPHYNIGVGFRLQKEDPAN